MEKISHEKRIKILFATHISGLGGGETSLLYLLSTFIENGFSPVLVCPSGQLYNKAEQLGITVVCLEFPPVRSFFGILPKFSFQTILKIYNIIKKHQVDIVHVESLITFYYFCVVAWLLKIPCVATYHGFWQIKSIIARIMLKYFCIRLYPVSQTTAQDILENGLLPDKKIKVIPLSLGNLFLSNKTKKSENRSIYGFPIDVPVVLQVARFQPIKGQMVLLEALAELIRLRLYPIPLIVLVGDVLDPTHEEAVNYKKIVELRAEESDLRKHVRILGWRDDIYQLMEVADIVVIPSDYESFSMTTIEAMAVGTLVIATSSGGPAEIIKNQVTGILIPPRNSNALALAIHEACSTPLHTVEIALRAKEYVTQNFSPQTRYVLLKNEYYKILSL